MTNSNHWDHIFETKSRHDFSWFEDEPTMSLHLVQSVSTPGSSVIDVGAGTSDLARLLVTLGYVDVTALDISQKALESTAESVVNDVDKPTFVVADVAAWSPTRTFDVWHDRAVFHFMVTDDLREGYKATLSRAVTPGGFAIIGTFAENGPEQCSGIAVARQSVESLANFFAEEFALVDSFDQIHRTPHGGDQHFVWVILRRK